MIKVLFWFSIPLVILSWARIFIYGFMVVMVIHTFLMAVLSYFFMRRSHLSQYAKAHVVVMMFVTLGVIGVPSQSMPIYGYPMSIMGVSLATLLFNRKIANRYLLVEMILIFVLGAISGAPEKYYQYLFEWVGYAAFQFYLILCLEKIRSHLGETIQNLNQAISAKENFLALMSHEIRTPLHGINLAAENIMEVDSDRDKLEMVEIITSSSKHLKGIIDDILDFSKLNKDKVKIERTYIDLEDFLTRIQLDYGNQAKRHGLEFIIDRDERLKGIVSDPIRLEQILRNLLSNAFKFTDNGKIELLISLAYSKPSSFQIIVKDTGRGISLDRLTTIFEEFEQESPEVSKTYGGTGLGLAIVKGLTEKLGGSVDVQSQYSKGTTFTLYFPYDEIEIEKAKLVSDNVFKRNIEKSEIEGSRVRPKINKRILIVEDNDINIKVLVKRLASLGIENLEVSKNGKEAIEACEKEKFDLIFMDIRMPVLDGLESTRLIRNSEGIAFNKETPIIGLSANSFEEDVRIALEAGMNSYLGKPFSRDDLDKVIKNHLID